MLLVRCGMRHACAHAGILSMGLLTVTAGQMAYSQEVRCGNTSDYPVLVYDANTRTAVTVLRSQVRDLLQAAPPAGYVYTNLFSLLTPPPPPAPPPAPPTFPFTTHLPYFCDGKPVEAYIFNRRLQTAYGLALTSVFVPPASTIDLRGMNPQPAPAAPAAPSGAAAPGSKGFAPVITGANLLSTDQALSYFLDDETMDKALSKVADDAAAVRAQAEQSRINANQYIQYVNAIAGVAGGPQYTTTPLGVTSLNTLMNSWNDIAASAPPAMALIDDAGFGDLTGRADRLEIEVTRLNAKIQAYPVVDAYINLRAGLSVLNDDYRGVQSEKDAIVGALQILTDMRANAPKFLRERREAELRTALRAHYSGTTISDATLARIIEDMDTGHLPRAMALAPNPCPPPAAADAQRIRYCAALDDLDIAVNGPPPVQGLVDNAGDALDNLRDGINDANEAEGDALRAINDVYDSHRAPVLLLNLDLQGNSGNLFVYYTISRSEQFNRYEVVNDIAQPISNCALSANTNNAGGFAPCTTAATGTQPAPSATYAASPFPPGPAQAPAAVNAQPAAGSAAPSGTTASFRTGASGPDYYGRLQVHHFSHGALVTGVAYDSVANRSFQWVACSTDPTNAVGNLPGPGVSGACVSPSVTTTNPTPLTYYQLIESKEAPVAAIVGVNLFLFNRGLTQDMFPSRHKPAPELFLGGSAYPLNHYSVGLSVEPERGWTVTAGFTAGAQKTLPSTFAYASGSYAAANPPIPSASKFAPGFLFMVGFDTRIFGSIFNGSIFQSVISIGTANSSAAAATGQSSSSQ